MSDNINVSAPEASKVATTGFEGTQSSAPFGGILDHTWDFKQDFERKVAQQIISDNKSSEKAATAALEPAISNNLATRYGVVLAEGTKYGVANLGKDFGEAFTTKLPETGQKALYAGAFAVGMRLLAPAPDVVKITVGTILAANFIKDAVQPAWDALAKAGEARNLKALDQAAQKMGSGESQFVVDSTIGITAGGVANWGAGKVIDGYKEAFGTKAPQEPELPFEEKIKRIRDGLSEARDRMNKENFYRHGNGKQSYSEYLDELQGANSEAPYIKPVFSGLSWGDKAMLAAKKNAGSGETPVTETVGSGIAPAAFEPSATQAPVESTAPTSAAKPKVVSPEPATGSATSPATIMELLEKQKAEEAAAKESIWQRFSKPGYKPNEADGQKVIEALSNGKSITPEPANLASTIALSWSELIKNEAKPKVQSDAPPVPPKYNSLQEQMLDERSPDNMGKRSAVARALQAKWTPKDALMTDIRDRFISTLMSVTDESRQGSLLPADYSKSTKELVDLVKQVHTPKDLAEVKDLLYFHTIAASLVEMKEPLTLDLNNFSQSEYQSFLQRLAKAGVSNKVLLPGLGPLNAICDSKGGSNFTIPNLPGVTERGVIVQDLSENELMSVWAGIDHHEMGHNYLFGRVMRLPENMRDDLINKMVDGYFQDAGIKDVEMQVPVRVLGGSPATKAMKKSDVFKIALKAQANENTADLFAGEKGLAPLGQLLESVRPGGKLEARSVMGSPMVDPGSGNTLGFEVHDFDINRIMRGAEQIKYQAMGDQVKLDPSKVDPSKFDEFGMALSNAWKTYAKGASQPGDSYTWLSVDQKGKGVSIPRNEWEGLNKWVMKLQYENPLDAFEDKTWKDVEGNDVIPGLKRIDELGTKIADSMDKGLHTVPDFDKTKYTIGDVFDAGNVAWGRAVARGVDAHNALQYIDMISRDLRSQYRGNPGNSEPLAVISDGAHSISQGAQRFSKLAAVSPADAVSYLGTKAYYAPIKLLKATPAFMVPLGGADTSNYLGQIVQDEQMRQDMARQVEAKKPA